MRTASRRAAALAATASAAALVTTGLVTPAGASPAEQTDDADAMIAALSALTLPTAPEFGGGVELEALGTYDGGGLARAEIVAFDTDTDRMFISNDDEVRVDIVSIADPAAPALITSFDVTPYGDGVNGVSARDGIVVAAVETDPTFDGGTGVPTPENGSVVFFDTDGTFISEVEVGVLPDMVTFSPDGETVVVAGEGEPVCAADVGGDEDENIGLAVDPLGTVAVIDLSGGAATPTSTLLDFTGFDTATLQAAGVRIFWPGSTAAEDLEPEFVTIDDGGETAFITLQEANAVAVVDLMTPSIDAVVPLGTKDMSQGVMDPSNRDGRILLAPWDVQGMYMPDTIDTLTTGGETYLVTANEGDARDYDCYSEEERMADLDYTDSTLSDALLTAVDTDALLGRLNSTTAMPTADPIDTLYAYGARSFTIWSDEGDVVWDSGSEFAEIVARDYPEYFNTNADDEAGDAEDIVRSMADGFDARSDDKGTEPEALVVGTIGARSYAFVGLERQGGVMIYDVTDPTAPHVEDYVNLALDELAAEGDFTEPGTTDVSPEGMYFISAADSPTGTPLLLVANELSGTTTIYEVTVTDQDLVSVDPARIVETRTCETCLTVDGEQQGDGPLTDDEVYEVQVTGRADVPDGASAAFVNATAVRPDGPGFLTLYPCDTTRPGVSTVNYQGSDVAPNAALVKLDDDGTFCVYTRTGTDLIIDINGYVPADATPTPVDPARIVETRTCETCLTVDGEQQGDGPLTDDEVYEVQVTGRADVPDGASAAFVNATAVRPDGPGFLTLYPCDTTRPGVSTVNYQGSDVAPNAALVKLDDDGTFCVYTRTGTDLIIDINGYVPADATPTPVDPARIVETRTCETCLTVDGEQQGDGPLTDDEVYEVQVTGRADVPDGASAAFVNATAVRPDGPGFLTLYPCDTTRPGVSTVNYQGSDVAPNAALVKLDDDGTFCVYTRTGTDLIIDINGYVPGQGD